jgi:hypothetical protein
LWIELLAAVLAAKAPVQSPLILEAGPLQSAAGSRSLQRCAATNVALCPLAPTEPEIDDPVAFMASLASPQYREQGIKELARQHEIARTSRPQRDTARAFGPKSPARAPGP